MKQQLYLATLVTILMALCHSAFSQDIIVLQNGNEIKASVSDIGLDAIKYKKFENLSGPLYTMKKSEVFMIKYVNGTKDVFGIKAETPKVEIKTETPKAETKTETVVVQNQQTVVSGTTTAVLTDTRDGKTYKTIVLGEHTWMAQNLAYKAGSGCWAYDDNEANVAAFGYLYNWETAKNVCPMGWHLPNEAELRILAGNFGGEYHSPPKKGSTGSEKTAGIKMKSSTGWEKEGNGIDEKGFTGLPAGIRMGNNSYKQIGIHGYWWSSTEDYGYNADMITAYALSLGSSFKVVDLTCLYIKTWGLSVRCMKDYLR